MVADLLRLEEKYAKGRRQRPSEIQEEWDKSVISACDRHRNAELLAEDKNARAERDDRRGAGVDRGEESYFIQYDYDRRVRQRLLGTTGRTSLEMFPGDRQLGGLNASSWGVNIASSPLQCHQEHASQLQDKRLEEQRQLDRCQREEPGLKKTDDGLRSSSRGNNGCPTPQGLCVQECSVHIVACQLTLSESVVVH